VLFARLFAGPPDAALYTRLRENGLERLAQAQNVDLTSDLLDPDDEDSCATELDAEYTRITEQVTLRESDYSGTTEDPVVAIGGYLTEQGLRIDTDADLPLDHLSFSLGIMGELVGREGGDSEQHARSFFLRHLRPWAQHALTEVAEAADRSFYRGVAAMLSAFLGSESRLYQGA